MLGIIVAPNANVYQAAGNLNGQIISNIAEIMENFIRLLLEMKLQKNA